MRSCLIQSNKPTYPARPQLFVPWWLHGQYSGLEQVALEHSCLTAGLHVWDGLLFRRHADARTLEVPKLHKNDKSVMCTKWNACRRTGRTAGIARTMPIRTAGAPPGKGHGVISKRPEHLAGLNLSEKDSSESVRDSSAPRSPHLHTFQSQDGCAGVNSKGRCPFRLLEMRAPRRSPGADQILT